MDAANDLADGHGLRQRRLACTFAGGTREPVHPSITTQQISNLVDRFYDRLWDDPVLGPIFLRPCWGGPDRSQHLDKMKSLLGLRFVAQWLLQRAAGPRARQTAPRCAAKTSSVWVGHFREDLPRRLRCLKLRPLVIASAERIAKSLWLAMFATPFNTAPDWRDPIPTTCERRTNCRDHDTRARTLETTAGAGHNSGLATIHIETRLFNSLQKYAGSDGWRRHTEFPAGTTVGDVVRNLGLPSAEIFLVLRNGRDVTGGLVGAPVNQNVALEDGDVLAFSGPVPYSYGYGAPIV